ncbi:MAG TPA: substrate-binding domain-containing protein [Thermoplasmata archaeon]|nr:substrate-binding domain-containing protein [Thermoplasmata archaeon]
MRPLVRNAVLVGVVLAVGIAGFAGGWLLKPASGSGTSSQTLWVVAAGSLEPILPSIASAYANVTAGVTDPLSAQLYEGSTAAASSLAGGSQPYDVFVAADFRTIPQDVETPAPSVASWEVVFASDPVVLAYEPSVSALSGISSANWWTKIVGSNVLLGVPNASADPLGANAIFTVELQDAAASLGGSLYGHFFAGTPGALASPTSSTRYVTENNAATALSTGEVDAYLIYRSYAVADHLSYVNLSTEVDLGGTSPANVTTYAGASTTVLSGTGTKVESGAPVLFSLTVPSTAKSALLGTSFAAYLLSNATAATWTHYGFEPLAQEWSDHPSKVPAVLSGSPPGLAPLPSYLASYL